ncbi:hypothetical protein ACN47E_009858 [Coniothyrium glycines]
MHQPTVSKALFPFLTFSFLVAATTTAAFDFTNLKLSSSAEVFLRNTPGHTLATARWQSWRAPDIASAVSVATTADVASTIQFANRHNISFTAYSGGHGGTSALGDVKDGIQINLRKLNTITLSDDGTYVTVGGGIKSKELIDALWAMGKWTTTGMCECTGAVAVALGGGHGLLQGRYGLLADQILGMEVVTADGSIIRVSQTENQDLFWAMRGAGHNFGVVTSVDWKVYDVPNTDIGGRVWSYELFIWEATEANIRSVYEIAKKLTDSGKQHDGLILYAVVGIIPDISEKPVLAYYAVWNGPLSTIKEHTAEYHALSPLSVTSDEGVYIDAARWLSLDKSSITCRVSELMPGTGVQRFPVDTKTYNIEAMVGMLDKYHELIASSPAFGGSLILIEQYSTRAVTEADKSKTAIPWRENVLLIAPALVYPNLDMATEPPKLNTAFEELIWAKGNEIRQILVDGARKYGGHHAYVNYASGGETEAEWYGKENLSKLRHLKKTWDPRNQFGFYAPIRADGEKHVEKSEL